MAIEVSVRKEIKEYQEKLIFGLSIRQFVCVLVTVVLSVVIGVLNYFFLGFAIDDIGLFIMFLSIPILAFGWYQKDGMHLEEYLRIVKKYRDIAQAYPYLSKRSEGPVIEAEDKKEAKKRSEAGN